MDKIKNILKNFCQITSIHGFIYIGRNKRKVKKFWAVFTLLMITVCLWKCGVNLVTYLKYNVKTTTTTKTATSVDFPSITFCPKYAFKKSGVSTIKELPQLIAMCLANEEKNIGRLMREVQYV